MFLTFGSYSLILLTCVKKVGSGRRPHPVQVVKYVQVVKKRVKGRIVNVSTRMALDNELEILELLQSSERCQTISTSLVESRNGSFRQDNKRQSRKTKCHSKRIAPHDAQVIFLKAVYNLTRSPCEFQDFD